MASSDRGTVHVIGAGLAGLAAAVRLAEAGRPVVVHEAALQPGGRCRSYLDRPTGMLIDNGTHLTLSGNYSLLSFAQTVGSTDELDGPAEAEFQFADLVSNERWTLRFNDGRFPWWLFDRERRVPQTGVVDYLPLARLMWVAADRTIADVTNCSGPIYERMLRPLLLAALNIDPREGSARLAQGVIRETLAAGGRACRPLLARRGIGNVYVEPALRYLAMRGVPVVLQDELRALTFADGRIAGLDLTKGGVALSADDRVILAVPSYAAASLLPDLNTPTEFCGIVNAHFKIDPPAHMPPMLGVVNGLCEWVFAHPGRISVTISDAGRLFKRPRAELAAEIWREVARFAGLSETLPPWQMVRERRATFAATPEQNARRPDAQTAWRNLFLAGDWTATGLPATMEGAVRSGNRAADLALGLLRAAA
jgi:squalene-associated FAD-dependent desaturase